MTIRFSSHLGEYTAQVQDWVRRLASDRVVERILARDHTVWRPESTEIVNRLGWLDIANRMLPKVPRLNALADGVRDSGYTRVVLLGMGGSSLAPEMFAKTLHRNGYPLLTVVDSTDPGAVLGCQARLEPEQTLFIVSTKSGGTVETISLGKYFHHWMVGQLGARRAGSHFWAITDPGSTLIDWAQELGFARVLLSDPNIGGRYSALSMFGLVPAALVGADVERLLQSAIAAAEELGPNATTAENPALLLGAALGSLALAGRDKLSLFLSPALASFGDWVEQLVAESLGKEGRGVVPVTGELPAKAEVFGVDRFFAGLWLARSSRDEAHKALLAALERKGHPAVEFVLRDRCDLGAQIWLWELATAIAAVLLKVQPFDQPNVEAAKVLARQVVADYRQNGRLPASSPVLCSGELEVYGEVQGKTPEEALAAFVKSAPPGSYVAIQAYLTPRVSIQRAVQALRRRIRDKTHLATTVGFGPRFLHSTGQMHKGDGGKGWFIQLTAAPPRVNGADDSDPPIPEDAGQSQGSAERVARPMTFGVLVSAQAAGDWQAMRDKGRHTIRIHLGRDVQTNLRRLQSAIK